MFEHDNFAHLDGIKVSGRCLRNDIAEVWSSDLTSSYTHLPRQLHVNFDQHASFLILSCRSPMKAIILCQLNVAPPGSCSVEFGARTMLYLLHALNVDRLGMCYVDLADIKMSMGTVLRKVLRTARIVR